MEKVWTIRCNNYHGEYSTYYFANYDVALESFNKLCEKHKDYAEYKEHIHDEFDSERVVSWFDAHYNEYSTFINLEEGYIPQKIDVVIDIY